MDLHQRLTEFFKRLEAAPPAANAEEAFALVCRLIEEVEDELCPVPRQDPPPLLSTGRMYAPKEDHVKRFANGLIVADARHHRIYCRADGGISIVRMPRKSDWQVFTIQSWANMSAPLELQNLIGEVAHNYPSASLEFDPLPSGVCFLWVTVADRNFVIEYDPKRGAGVSENLPDTPPFVGHDEAFDSLGSGITRFKSMLAEAARNEPAGTYVLHDKKN